MKVTILSALFLIAFLSAFSGKIIAKDEIIKNQMLSGGKERSYYLFVPSSIKTDKPAPLLILLHGSGRDGKILVEHWRKIAEREGIILVGPNALNSANWSIPADAPEFIRNLAEELKSKYAVDSRRVYLFGHSAGAGAGLILSLLESEYFTATAVSAGSLRAEDYDLFNNAERKIPVALFVGTNDPFFPLKIVRQTRDAFNEQKFIVELTEIPNLDHNYYSKSTEINEKAWTFLSKYRLDNEPKYNQYNFKS